MKFWKFQYLGENSMEMCIREKRFPMAQTNIPGLATTDQEVLDRVRPGDGALIAELLGEQAKIYAIGKVIVGADSQLEVIWVRNINFRQPNERGGLIHWQTKTAFEISPEPAKRYGLKELVEHYVKVGA